MTKKNPDAKTTAKTSDEARREFLHKAAKVGIATPAAVTLMLAVGNRRARAVCGVGSQSTAILLKMPGTRLASGGQQGPTCHHGPDTPTRRACRG